MNLYCLRKWQHHITVGICILFVFGQVVVGLSWGFTPHSTWNRSFWRCSSQQPFFGLLLKKLKPNSTFPLYSAAVIFSVLCCDIVEREKSSTETPSLEQFHSPSIDDGMYVGSHICYYCWHLVKCKDAGVAMGKMWDTSVGLKSVGRWVTIELVRLGLGLVELALVSATVISAWINPRTFTPQFTHCHTRIPAFYP